MENTVSPAKSGIQLGVLFGVIMILEFVVGYVMEIDPQINKTFGLFINFSNFLILPLLLIYIACNSFKKNINLGFINIRQSLKIGISICVIAGMTYSIFTSLFNFISPEYFDEVYRKMRLVAINQSPTVPVEQIDMSIAWMKKFSTNPALAIPSTIVIFAFIGLIYSLIIGAIVKKDNPQSF